MVREWQKKTRVIKAPKGWIVAEVATPIEGKTVRVTFGKMTRVRRKKK